MKKLFLGKGKQDDCTDSGKTADRFHCTCYGRRVSKQPFAVVWPVLYLLIAAAYYLVMESPKGEARTQAMTFYLVQLFLNFLWSPLFFRWGAYAWAFRLLCTIFLLALATIICFALIDRRTLWLMTPYLVWLVFAMLLNKSIAVLN